MPLAQRRRSAKQSGGGVVLWTYRIRGKVHHGDGRGKTLGFPTANLHLRGSIPDGIYCAFVHLRGAVHPALAFIGAPITFGLTKRRAEIFLLRAHTDTLYDQWITVTLVKRLRGNKKFQNARALQRAMQRDLQLAKTYFNRVT